MSSTIPIASWPIDWPASLGSIDAYGHRSLPQIQALVTRRIASVGSRIDGSGTSSMRTSPAPRITVARIFTLPFCSKLPCPLPKKAPDAQAWESLLRGVLTGSPWRRPPRLGCSPDGRAQRKPRVPHLTPSDDHPRAGGPCLLRPPPRPRTAPRGG